MKKYLALVCVFLFIYSCNQNTRLKETNQALMQLGSRLFQSYGCAVCHSLEGKEIYGPPLNNIYLKNIIVIRNGKELSVVADRKYLKRAISDPRYEKVKEYNHKEMPLTSFKKKDVDLLVDYLIELSKDH